MRACQRMSAIPQWDQASALARSTPKQALAQAKAVSEDWFRAQAMAETAQPVSSRSDWLLYAQLLLAVNSGIRRHGGDGPLPLVTSTRSVGKPWRGVGDVATRLDAPVVYRIPALKRRAILVNRYRGSKPAVDGLRDSIGDRTVTWKRGILGWAAEGW